jgi:multidrug efflux system membrane fusion protein
LIRRAREHRNENWYFHVWTKRFASLAAGSRVCAAAMVEREVRNIADFRSKKDSRPDTMLAPSEPDAETLHPHPPHPETEEEDLHEQPRAAKRGRWRWLIYLLLLALIGFGAWRFLAPKTQNQPHTQAEAQPVGAAKVATGDIDQTLSGLGTVTPLATITVQTQINGQLTEVGFKEGQMVQKGDFLAQIDPRPYQAALDLAEGQLAHDQGLLDQAESDLQRYTTLSRQDSIAQQQVADQKFLVQQDKGLVQQDQANIETAKLNLVYCHIVAPVTGRVGLRLVDPGNYVQTGSPTGLVVLTEVEPISIVFVLPEDAIPDVWREVRSGKTLTVTAYNRTDNKLIATGALESVDNEIDTTTGTVKLRATFPNTDEALFPNQFVNARLLVRKIAGATIAPVAAIQQGAPGTFVFLIKPDGGTVGVAKVATGVTEGDQIQIESGLKAGDSVVVDGADRLRDGSKVRVSADQSNAAPNLNDGPGAPPGQQPDNGKSVPPALRATPETGHGSTSQTGAGSTPQSGAGPTPQSGAGSTSKSGAGSASQSGAGSNNGP